MHSCGLGIRVYGCGVVVLLLPERTRARYRTEVGGHLVNIHPGSVLFGRPAAPAVVFNEVQSCAAASALVPHSLFAAVVVIAHSLPRSRALSLSLCLSWC